MLKILIWSLQQKTQTCLDELSHVAAWEAANNMQLNKAKTKELFSDCVASSRRKRTFHRRSQTLSEWLASQYSMSSSTTNWRQLTACTSLLYAPCVLRCHGVRDQSLKDVFQAIEGLLAKITYCLPAWSGLCTAADRIRLNSFLKRCVKLGYYRSNEPPSISSIADDAENSLFENVLRNPQHVLQPYLEERPQLRYNLRNRPGINKSLFEKTVDLNDKRLFSS